MAMGAEQQYIGLYQQCREMIRQHSSEAMNLVRDEAFRRFKAQGFPSQKTVFLLARQNAISIRTLTACLHLTTV